LGTKAKGRGKHTRKGQNTIFFGGEKRKGPSKKKKKKLYPEGGGKHTKKTCVTLDQGKKKRGTGEGSKSRGAPAWKKGGKKEKKSIGGGGKEEKVARETSPKWEEKGCKGVLKNSGVIIGPQKANLVQKKLVKMERKGQRRLE